MVLMGMGEAADDWTRPPTRERWRPGAGPVCARTYCRGRADCADASEEESASWEATRPGGRLTKEYEAQGHAYRELCRRLDQVDITLEQFEAEVTTLIKAASGVDAYGEYRDPFAPLSAADPPPHAPAPRPASRHARPASPAPAPRPARPAPAPRPASRHARPPSPTPVALTRASGRVPMAGVELERLAAQRHALVAQAAAAEATRRLAQAARPVDPARLAAHQRYDEQQRALDGGLCDVGHIHRTRLQAVVCNQTRAPAVSGPRGFAWERRHWARQSAKHEHEHEHEHEHARKRDKQLGRPRFAASDPPARTAQQKEKDRRFWWGLAGVLLLLGLTVGGSLFARALLARPNRMAALASSIGTHLSAQPPGRGLYSDRCSEWSGGTPLLFRPAANAGDGVPNVALPTDASAPARPRIGYADCYDSSGSVDMVLRCVAGAARRADCTAITLSTYATGVDPQSFRVRISANGSYRTDPPATGNY
jgi:hypothetical protein